MQVVLSVDPVFYLDQACALNFKNHLSTLKENEQARALNE